MLFENLDWLEVTLKSTFKKNLLAQPIFTPKDYPFSPVQVSNKKVKFWDTLVMFIGIKLQLYIFHQTEVFGRRYNIEPRHRQGPI